MRFCLSLILLFSVMSAEAQVDSVIAFNALGDKHANYYSPEGVFYRLNNDALIKRYSDSLKAGWQIGLKIDNKILDDVAYINISTLGVGKQQDIDKYANWIYDAVNKLQAKNPKGWIIDFGKKYPDVVKLQVKIPGYENFYEVEKDPTVMAAINSLK